ncbi:MAG: enediyne polyketide synthase [Myxococcota bacterium]|jgi:enediyne polyketide synthase
MGIAVVGVACRYPGAASPSELWEDTLALRRAFRRMPDARLPLDDYFSSDRSASDKTYSTRAAVLTGWHFDRVRFRVAGSTFRQTDLAHWLALEVASEALADAGFPDGAGLPHDTTGVLLGNTLTGEFSRAQTLRLRWPYVRRVLDAALTERGMDVTARQELIAATGQRFRAPFPAVNEDTLAGGLSNTIAGRICNVFDLHGGGYTLDGACSSSLLATASACSSLTAGDLDCALVGGVDLSIDPFEVLGFAKTGALAESDMRVFDARSAGFWPGEGCGFAVLMREQDARATGRRIYAIIRGWGISSDGSGGMTRPEVAGQRLAFTRAYRKAGYGPETVGYFEGHGTGTAVGDTAELGTLLSALQEAESVPEPRPVVGSIKALIGHTKAAAGIAGLIKATLAVHHRILPPMTGHRETHPLLAGSDLLRIPAQAEPWPDDRPVRAAASAMGFGGINAHITIEHPEQTPSRPRRLRPEEQILRASAQDTELFLLDADDRAALSTQIERLVAFARDLSLAELGDLAAALSKNIQKRRLRVAIIAGTPEAFLRGLERLQGWIAAGETARLDVRGGVFLGEAGGRARIGLLFPGQGAPANLTGGAWRRRFASVAALYERASLPQATDGSRTEVAQPAIATASLAALTVLDDLGIHGEVAVGHSLGELCALSWAGALSESALLATTRARGQAMAELGDPTGAMLSLSTDSTTAASLLPPGVGIACHNSPRHTVVSGQREAIDQAAAHAEAAGIACTPLRVSHAFHSPLVSAAVPALTAHLTENPPRPLRRPVISTVTGTLLTDDDDLTEILARQVVEPVRFVQALTRAASRVDLLLEVGPGQSLAAMASHTTDTPIISLRAGGDSLRGLLLSVGAVWSMGGAVRPQVLFSDRFTRPFSLDWVLDVLENPCERDRPSDTDALPEPLPVEPAPTPAPAVAADSPLALVRALVARRVELPVESVGEKDRLLSDLHLNSIMVGEIASEAARLLGAPPLRSPTEYADAEVGALAEALAELVSTGGERPDAAAVPPGVSDWVRPFVVSYAPEVLPAGLEEPAGSGQWRVIAPSGHALRESLQAAVSALPGEGTIVLLPDLPTITDVQAVLAAAKATAADRGRFVLVQGRFGAGGIVRTLHLEVPTVDACVLDLPADLPGACEIIVEEARSVRGFVEARYDIDGTRHTPRLRLWQAEGDSEAPLGSGDVVLISGGGKGITAECALELARWTGASLAILGRSSPDTDLVLAENLDRLASVGAPVEYFQADVSDPYAVRAAVEAAEKALGPITGILHGAGRNVPALIAGLDSDALAATFAPKVDGLANLLAAIDPERLRLLVGFGSIIGRSGMRGNADYAVANEWLRAGIEDWDVAHPKCQCLVVEWSVWSGVGMGARLSALDALSREGITAIPVEEGVAWMRRLLSHRAPVSVVVTGRYGGLPTLQIGTSPMPFLRFLDEVVAHTPGVELVADTEVSVRSDPYLDDHVFKGQRLVPAVMGFEAMAQAAQVLTGLTSLPTIEEVVFTRPIVVPTDRPLRMRTAALVTAPGVVEAVVRAEDSGFQVDCFRATLRFAPHEAPASDLPSPARDLDFDVDGDLYGSLLFHEGRFRRVEAYEQIRGRGVIGRIGVAGERPWFAAHLPGQLILGDPGLQDAAIHVHQAAVPQSPLLPRSVARVQFGDITAPGPWRVQTREIGRTALSVTVDVEVRTLGGALRERWEGLVLAMVAGTDFRGPWPEPVLGAYLEHHIGRLFPGAGLEASVALGAVREDRRARVAADILGDSARVYRRPDGKPVLNGRGELSFSHAADLSLGVSAQSRVSCDLQGVTARSPEEWRALLGSERMALAELLTQEGDEQLDASASQVWGAVECLRKAGLTAGSPLTLREHLEDGWSVLSAGALTVLTGTLSIRRSAIPLAVAVAVALEP